MERICIKVENRYPDYMDFTVSYESSDDLNLYRYDSLTGKMNKLFGFSGYGQAVRGKKRKAVEALAKIVFDNNLPFAVAM